MKQKVLSILALLLMAATSAWALEQDGEGYYLIGSVQDWKDFATLVQTTPTANAKMTADIDLGDDQTMVSSPTTNTYRFKGVFDGQGHTLTVAYNSGDWESGHDAFATPFPNIEGATIKNLHVAGTQQSLDTHTAGIAANVWNSGNVLEKVWISTAIKGESKNQTQGEYAAFVGCMKSGASITITDCLFTGSIEGKGNDNGGLIGYFDGGNSATVKNCLSTGSFSYTGSGNVFDRGGSNNSFYLSFSGTVNNATQKTAEQLADGTVATALGASWVQNGSTPMLKVFTSVNLTANAGDVAGEYWATYYNATQGFTVDASTTIYKGKLNGTSLQLTAVTDIAAGQAVILKSTTASITLTPAASASSDFTGNDLKGGTTVTDGYDAYTLSRGSAGTGAVGFYKFSGGSLDGSKAHLEIPTSADTRSFIGFGDGTTAIEAPALAEDEAAEWYSLDGRRLSGKPARRGVYVKNGQKVVIK